MYSQTECPNKPINGKEGQGIIHWQSDYPIVSQKQGNDCGEKGVAVMQEDIRDTSARTRQQVETKLITSKASNKVLPEGKVLISLTLRAKENPKYRFMTLAYLLVKRIF
ncbi:MAG: hypothetical protein AB1297_04820 [bacterium]